MNDELIEAMAADAEERAETADTRPLEELGRAALDLEYDIALIEQALKQKNKDLALLMERLIPQALAVAGISEFGFTTAAGDKARIENDLQVFASWTNVADKEKAVEYLESNGFPGGVVTDVTLRFTEDERELAENVGLNAALIAGRDPIIARTVNPSSLRSFIKQRLKEDPTFDYALVGGTVQTKAKFTKRK